MSLPPLDALATQLRARLAEPLPGLEAQLAMAPPLRGNDEEELRERARDCRRAGVLILLYPLAGGEPGFVLTLRQRALQVHSGQVSLPGGAIREGESAREAALREAHEEVGVPPEMPDVLGELTELYIPPSHFCVTPTVAASRERPEFARQRSEVAAIIEAPLADLLDPECRKTARWRLRGEDTDVPYFALCGYEVWGATAMMLAELAAVLE
jgi:8-oxo-dGTP pyrophosphatase MutT (NUDIX family)